MDMKKNVSVKIYSEIEELVSDEKNGEKGVITTLSDGTLSCSDGKVVLEYTDNDGNPDEIVKTTIEFDESTPNIVLVVREGELNSSMLFEVGKKHDAVYRTAGLEARLAVSAKRIENDILSGGRLYLDYVLSLDPLGKAGERAKLTITVSERQTPKIFGEYDE